MKKKLFYAVIAVALLLYVASLVRNSIENRGPFDFSNIRWDMTRAQVLRQASRNGSPRDTKYNFILSHIELFGKSARFRYSFDSVNNDVLTSANCRFIQDFAEQNVTLDFYQQVIEGLTKEYGEPRKQQTLWFSDTYKGNEEQQGKAYIENEAISFATWETNTTVILAELKGFKKLPALWITIYYEPKPLKPFFSDIAYIFSHLDEYDTYMEKVKKADPAVLKKFKEYFYGKSKTEEEKNEEKKNAEKWQIK